MPIYMDVHVVPGVKAKDVAEAHLKDVMLQEEHNCRCMTYWVDEDRESVFCLVEAPHQEAVEEMHSRAHGLIPNKVIEVNSMLVQSFLGRIYDPPTAETSSEGLKVFKDPSFRTLLLIKICDPVLLEYKYGKEKSDEIVTRQFDIVRKNIEQSSGREVEHSGGNFIASFLSATKAINCAINIQQQITDCEATDLRMAVNAGEPVAKSNILFGDTLQLAAHLCMIAQNKKIAVSSAVKDLITKDHPGHLSAKVFSLPAREETQLSFLFSKLEDNWQDAEFDIPDYCQTMAMSRSQLYRKTIALTGLSPNILLKEFRLEKAKELLKKRRYSISEITFDSGFTSPSYFTKCFKTKYGLLPMAYLDLLH